MDIFKDRFLILLLLFGFLIRIMFSHLPGFKFDIDTNFAWAIRLNEVGFSNFYSNKIWTSYTPGFLYILAFLGYLKTLIQIPDSYFFVVLKLPSIIGEIIMGYVAYLIIPNKYKLWKNIALILILFNPAFIFNSAVFGQFDGLFSLVLLISVYSLIQRKLISSSIFYALAFILKPQAVIVIPVYLFYLIENFSIKNIIKLILPGAVTTTISFLPFFPANFLNGPVNLVLNILNTYPYASIFAYNFWGILNFWIPDNRLFLNINYQNWGFIFLGVFWLIIAYFHIRIKKLSVFTLAAISALSFFFLLTRMHERYLYPGLVFLIILAALKKSSLLITLTIILSLIHLLNLYYVYIYYNQFYLKLPEIIYIPALYNIADRSIQLLSILSTFIFILISISILKLNNESKKT